MLRLLMASALAGLCACAPTTIDRRSQLEASAGIPPEEAGQYSRAQLLVIKSTNESDRLTESRKTRRIENIRRGYSPIFVFGVFGG